MKKILTVIGARPQIIKAAALSRAISAHFKDSLEEKILHTGQHYDSSMSQVFFDELGIPKPHFQLNVGSVSHAEQTAEMLKGIEQVLLTEKYDGLLVYGDTNSTLAGALAATKIHVPVVHVEAGLRSFNKRMPEEVNRVLCDHCSTLLFAPTETAVRNLKNEGFDLEQQAPFSVDHPKVFHCGDVMFDNSMHFASLADQKVRLVEDMGLSKYVLVTIHRPYNTDAPLRLKSVMLSLLALSQEDGLEMVFPMHPRTRKLLRNYHPELFADILRNPAFHLIEPVSFLEMIQLEKNATLIVTDSGGVQKEAYFFQKPCLVMRTETEWVELIETGAAKLQYEMGNVFVETAVHFIKNPPKEFPPIFGTGVASNFICEQLLEHL
jgi:UDP-GlcNAc3NAcA epimerase